MSWIEPTPERTRGVTLRVYYSQHVWVVSFSEPPYTHTHTYIHPPMTIVCVFAGACDGTRKLPIICPCDFKCSVWYSVRLSNTRYQMSELSVRRVLPSTIATLEVSTHVTYQPPGVEYSLLWYPNNPRNILRDCVYEETMCVMCQYTVGLDVFRTLERQLHHTIPLVSCNYRKAAAKALPAVRLLYLVFMYYS